MAEVKPAEVSAILRQQLSGFKSESQLEEVGTVLQVGDGIARIYGLTNVQSGELIEFENGLRAIVLNLEEDNVGAVLLGPSKGIKEGDTVKRTNQIASINVGDTYSSSGSCRRGKDNEKLEIVNEGKYSKFDFELNDYFEIDRLEVNKKWVDVSGLDFKPEWDKYRESINDSIAKVKLEHLENSFQNGGTET